MHILGIMGSGVSSRLEAICEAIENGELTNVKVGAVVCNVADAPFVQVSQAKGIPTYIVDSPSARKIDQKALESFQGCGVELVLLAGYRRKVGTALLQGYPGHILNIHPGPLPQFGGKGMMGITVQETILAAGAEYAGPVVHVVDGEYDHGPILGYYPMKVRPDDTAETLRDRCVTVGNKLYIREIRDFLYRMDHPEEF